LSRVIVWALKWFQVCSKERLIWLTSKHVQVVLMASNHKIRDRGGHWLCTNFSSYAAVHTRVWVIEINFLVRIINPAVCERGARGGGNESREKSLFSLVISCINSQGMYI
jgi:hypothetical protein